VRAGVARTRQPGNRHNAVCQTTGPGLARLRGGVKARGGSGAGRRPVGTL